MRGVQVRGYVTNEQTEWQPTSRELIEDLESEWPGFIRFRDKGGNVVARPSWL